MAEHLARPGVETWVAYDRGTPAGYVELEPQDDGVVEIVYFGLMPAFRGRRIGGHLLSYGAARAWDLGRALARAARRPSGCGCTPAAWTARTPWTTTCGAGSRCFDTKVEEEAEVAAPGPVAGGVRPPARTASEPM